VGASLVACGVISWSRRPASRFGVLLAAAGFAWLVVELNNPAVGSPVLFTIGLVAYAACPAVVAHAALAYPDGRVGSRLERAGLVLAYASTCVAVGLLPALAFDPAAQGCLDCPRNLVGLTSSPALVEALSRAGLVAGLIWACGLAALAIARIARSSPAARLLTGPVLLALVVYLALVAGAYAHSIGRGFLSNDSVDRLLWLGQAAALAALTLGVGLAWARGAWARTSVARLVIDLGQAPAPGQLRDALARQLGDPTLDIAYPLGHELPVDADGRAVDLQVTDGQVVTRLVRGGRPVALLLHRADLLDDPGLIENVGAAAGLALDHERLQAHARAQLEQLRASRIRTVQSGDAERRRLERDLHDGAQQRLVVLSFALQLLRAELGDEGAVRMDAAEAELRAALGELRELAHGIYPAVLIDEGLASALEALAETGTVPLAIAGLPDERLEPTVEAAAYFLVAEVLKRATGPRVTVHATHANGRLVIDIDSAGVSADELVDVEDRIGALDGELTIQQTPGESTMICAEVPCAS
ncbi:MAG TPA: histidine kinase, partial [Solirubrobacteraceae bacterium]|nr:histidine kinase [Solirubrobacteraceae bacterium]